MTSTAHDLGRRSAGGPRDTTHPRRLAILAICTANICRSPMMEILLRDRLDGAHFEVASAGVRGWDGKPMDAEAAIELQRLGHEPGGFRSRSVTSHLLDSADVVLTATRAHRSKVLALNPRALHRTFTLVELATLADDIHASRPADLIAAAARRRSLVPGTVDIADPYRGGPEVHRDTADQILAAVITLGDRFNELAERQVDPFTSVSR